MRKILEQERIGDALSLVMAVRRASGTNYVIADGSGDVFHLECSGRDFDVLYPSGGIIGHSNHFVSPRLRHLDRFHAGGNGGQSLLRLSRINQHLEENRGEIDLTRMQQFARDHVDHPRSLCRHVCAHDPEVEQTKTLYGLVVQPDRGKIHVAAGSPCECEFVEYAV